MNGKVALITGASRGIGKQIAKNLAEDGFFCFVNYSTSEEEAMRTVKEIQNAGGEAQAVCADVADRYDVQSMCLSIVENYGQIDVLVNNAGISQQKLFTDISNEEWDRMFDVNIKGMYNTCKNVVPVMVRQKSGKIINISSIWGITGGSCEVHYSASKAAVIGFTKSLAKELGPSGICVNCVAPGVIDTEMNKDLSTEDLDELKNQTPLGVIGGPFDIANLVSYLASDKSGFITGQVISPNGGMLI